MSVTNIEICQRALVLIGVDPITSFEDGTAESQACATLYDDVYEGELSLYNWRFATGLQELTPLVDTPVARWEKAYLVPPGCLLIRGVFHNDFKIPYERYENKLYANTTDDDTLVCEFTYKPDESQLPAYFVQAMVMRMASVLAAAVTDDDQKTAIWDAKADAAFMKARLRESQAAGTKRLTATRFVRERSR